MKPLERLRDSNAALVFIRTERRTRRVHVTAEVDLEGSLLSLTAEPKVSGTEEGKEWEILLRSALSSRVGNELLEKQKSPQTCY